ncbi:Protein SPIRAL1-like 2 [Linum grandiflorum]
MGRGVSCGGGQSSLGYLFGSDAGSSSHNNNNPVTTSSNKSPPTTAFNKSPPTKNEHITNNNNNNSPIKMEAVGQSPKFTPGRLKNNYYRSEGQNCGNFITDRPTTKVHAAPGGGSSLGYLFGDPAKK